MSDIGILATSYAISHSLAKSENSNRCTHQGAVIELSGSEQTIYCVLRSRNAVLAIYESDTLLRVHANEF